MSRPAFGSARDAVTGLLLVTAFAAGALLLDDTGKVPASLEAIRSWAGAHFEAVVRDDGDPGVELERRRCELHEQISALAENGKLLAEEVGHLEQETRVFDRVVELAEEDLRLLAPSRSNPVLPARGHSIQRTCDDYRSRAACSRETLELLRERLSLLDERLDRLRNESMEIDERIAGLAWRTVESERGIRLIELCARCDETIAACSRYEAEALDFLEQRITRMESRQDAVLQRLTAGLPALDYEKTARRELGVLGPKR